MKAWIISLFVCLNIFLLPPVLAETRQVCVQQTDAKTKKAKQVCKKVKVHKKLSGTKVPSKKAK